MPRLGDRTTTDLLILMIAGTICVSVLGTMIALAVIEMTDPAADTSVAGSAVGNVINTLIGLLAGFLAGRTRAGFDRARDDRDDRDDQS